MAMTLTRAKARERAREKGKIERMIDITNLFRLLSSMRLFSRALTSAFDVLSSLNLSGPGLVWGRFSEVDIILA